MPPDSDVYFDVPAEFVHPSPSTEGDGGTRLLADCRRQRVLSPIDQDKADREWLPLVLAAGLQRFAIVLPTSALAAMNLEDRLGKIPARPWQIAYFKEGVEEVRTWISL